MPFLGLLTTLLSNGSAFGSHHAFVVVAAICGLSIICSMFAIALVKSKTVGSINELVVAFGRFFYSSFLKPYPEGDSHGALGQQAALESFYKVQVQNLENFCITLDESLTVK